MSGRIAVALLLTATLAESQVTLAPPGQNQKTSQANRDGDGAYGPPRPADLETITFAIDGYQRTHVITDGQVEIFVQGQYWKLRQSGVALLLIPGRNLDMRALERATESGGRTEVRGIVRRIRPKEYLKGVDLDLVEDPTLPPLPSPSSDPGLPRVSITALAIRERIGSDGGRREGAAPGFARQVIEEGSTYAGKKVRMIGQFRGKNFFGDLPATSARSKEDWVLKDGETAFWVTGKGPKGQGWALDPTYEGDMSKWVEVEGKPEVINGVLYFHASLVIPAKAPIVEK